MKPQVKNILAEVLREALKLPIDSLDKVDPTKLTKLAQKADVVIGESETLTDENKIRDIKSILFNIVSEEGFEDAAFYLAASLPVTPLRISKLLNTETWGEGFEEFIKGIPAVALEKFLDQERYRLTPMLNEETSIEILDAEEVQPGMIVYSAGHPLGKAILVASASEYPALVPYDGEGMLPDNNGSQEEDNFFEIFTPNDFLIAVEQGDDSIVGAYGQHDFYVPKDGANAPQDNLDRAGDIGPVKVSQPMREGLEATTPEQKQSIQDVKMWASELDLDIGVGEETVGDIIKFGFQGAENWATILIDPNGGIKVSGHSIKTFEDFSDIVSFFND